MIQWSEKFSVSHEGIDEQHKVLLSIMDTLAGLLQEEDYSYQAVSDVAARVNDYIVKHFQYEEDLMLQYEYPDMENHVKQHNKLRDKAGRFNIFDITTPREYMEEELVYLVDWLSGHIMHTDKKLGVYISQVDSLQ